MRKLMTAVALATLGGCTVVELDRMRGTQFPPSITRDGNVVTVGSIYAAAGRWVEVSQSAGDEADIAALGKDCITAAELDSLLSDHRTSPVAPVTTQNGTVSYVHGMITAHYGSNDDGTCNKTLIGTMFDTADRSAFALYYKKIADDRAKDAAKSDAYYLRSAAHEIGHAFNLHHGDGDSISSLMDQGYTVEKNVSGADVPYTFSTHALDHLQGHPDGCVLPGTGKFGGCNAAHDGYHGAMGIECP